MATIFDDPQVKDALEAGRLPDDIGVLDCPDCGETGYYNQGSHFECRACGAFFTVLDPEDDGGLCCGRYMIVDGFQTLQDWIDAAADDGLPPFP